ncbi:MAG: carbohydrate-binding family 9-like protein [Clostridia bacterium]|nr:carbohydrate-binding family 9-like protein [Clostridia bacterium]
MIFRKQDDTGFISFDSGDRPLSDFRTSAVLEVMPWRRAGEPLHCGRAEVCYDDSALYVRMRAYETDIIASRRAFGEPVCRDSCLEFFFAPVPGSNAYFNFEVNPLATMYVGFSPSGTREGSRLLPDPDIRDNAFFSASARFIPGGWEVSYAIPYAFIRRYAPEYKTPQSGEILRCNFYTCCDDAKEPYYSVWHTVDAPAPDYHRPESFGALVFE